MEHCFTRNSAACIYNIDITIILEQNESFIRMLARQYVSRRRTASVDEIEEDIKDLAQLTSIKLWLALEQKGCCQIRDIKSYIRRIVRNIVIDLSRRYKPTEAFITNDDGEIAQTYSLVASSLQMQNPVEVVEEAEMLESYSSKLTQEVLKLPHMQQHSMICSLKEQIDDILSLVDMFGPYNIEVDELNWPQTENERRSARTSLSIARGKMRATRQDDEPWY